MSDQKFRVLVTRAAHQGSQLAEQLRALGLEPVLVPALELVQPTSFAALDRAVAQLSRFDWLLFTSANAVEAFAARRELAAGGAEPPDGRTRSLPRIAVIGAATARALERHGLHADLVPPQAVAESLASALLPIVALAAGAPLRFLLVRAEEAREHLPETLRAAGAEVTIASAYRTVVPAASVEHIRTLFSSAAGVAAITFTSSSSARHLLALCEAADVRIPEGALRISIGPITSATLRELELPPHAEAPEATTAALAASTLQALKNAQQ